MILIDTQVLVWLRSGSSKLGRQAANVIERSWASGEVAVSAITFWEVAMLHDKGRGRFRRGAVLLTLLKDIGAWRQALIQEGLVEIAVDGEIGIRSVNLKNLHADPADRIIVATALAGHQLVTSDGEILKWPGPLSRLDARK